LIFTSDSRFVNIHDKLITEVENLASLNDDSQDLCSYSWITPMLLLFDVFLQPILIDKVNIIRSIEELEKIAKIHQNLESDKSNDTEQFISADIYTHIREKYLNSKNKENLLPTNVEPEVSSKKRKNSDDLTSSQNNKIIDDAFNNLPIITDTLPMIVRQRLLKLSILLLSKLNKKYSSLPNGSEESKEY
jgi:hypothetical protein